jgi:ectoine hydroxylase-related dioxygenase (phytanoyl-CoA dioxygenase family)
MNGSIVDQFQRQGVVVLRQLVDPTLLTELADAVEQNLAHPGEWASDYTPIGGSGRFFGDYVNWQRIGAYRRAALESNLPLVAQQLMRSTTVRFFHEHVLVKEPGTVEATPWHHDEPYYCVDGRQNVSLWISLDQVPSAAGLEFVVGSHRWDRRFVPRKFVDASAYAAADSGFELVPDIDAHRAEHEIVSFAIEPGDVLAFHFRTVHAAPGTAGLTPHRRRAVSLRYLGDDAVFATRPWLHSPPFDQKGLVVGKPFDDSRFPLIATPG